MDALLQLGIRFLAIADAPNDDEELRLRKRVGVIAGYFSVIAPLSLPIQARFHPASWPVAVALAMFAGGNLLLLARTRQLDRYVIGLIAAGTVFVPVANALGGGITGSAPGLVWGFLVPAYAILALGPRRATPWFAAFLIMLLVMVLTDPWARAAFGPAPYGSVVIGWTLNTVEPLAIVFVLLRFTDVRRRIAEARVEELLTNAIPASIARRLRRGEQRIAERYPATTVVFADIAGFTAWANGTDPSRVVAMLDDLFTRFDAAAAECGMEKIKTIGDAYMAVAGAPAPEDRHAVIAFAMACRMMKIVAAWRDAHGLTLQLRVGLASGPAVGGVIGSRRIFFDLWGDTVNTAARMESSGIPGRIQVSTTTRELLPESSSFEPRLVELKGLGTVTAYLAGIQQEPSRSPLVP